MPVLLCLLDTLPLFPPNLSYQSQSPIICGFMPKAYAQPWLGLHSLNVPHAPSFDSCRKAEDVLKEAIICSTRGGAVTTSRADPPTSTSTAPAQVSKDAQTLPLHDPPPSSSSAACFPPNTNVQNPLLHSDRNPAPATRMRVRHRGADQGEVDRVLQVHQDRVPGLAVAVSPRVGPQLGPKPVQAHDQFTRLQHWPEVLRSSLGMKPVGLSMMFHILLMRQMCPKTVYLCSTSPLLTTTRLANAKHVNLHAEVTPTSQLGRSNKSVKA